ncbi:MAG: stp 5, partial [Myxococcales bacterium]|nr:stp 5 [Myxococcales bacterium]
MPLLRAPKLTVHSFGITDQGRVRESNQDQFVNAKLSRAIQLQQSSLAQPKTLFGDEHGHLFVVADGMGGPRGRARGQRPGSHQHRGIRTKHAQMVFGLQGDNILAEFQVALRTADDRIFDEVSRRPELKGMATTLTMGYSTHSAL